MPKIITLFQAGQSLWLDYIQRGLLTGGGLKQLVDEGLRGVTSNPTIFHQAITGSTDYDDAVCDLLQADPEIDAATLYEWLTVQDVQMAADILRPVYESSKKHDGYVSVEVSPHLAHDTHGTISAARHLWKAVDRPNVMIKVPATLEGLPAIERLIAEGINVNATLLFAIGRYQEVAEAYVRGLAMNPEPASVASVASFFVSRVDTKVDDALDAVGTPDALRLKGKIAIANAKLAYQHFKEITQGEDFIRQRERGAQTQRLLWGSTSTKNPAYPELLYVEELVGRDTVNTVPPQTLDAFQLHGEVGSTLEANVDEARRDLKDLATVGVNLDKATQELEDEGVAKFADSYDQLLAALSEKRFWVAKSYAG